MCNLYQCNASFMNRCCVDLLSFVLLQREGGSKISTVKAFNTSRQSLLKSRSLLVGKELVVVVGLNLKDVFCISSVCFGAVRAGLLGPRWRPPQGERAEEGAPGRRGRPARRRRPIAQQRVAREQEGHSHTAPSERLHDLCQRVEKEARLGESL